MGSWNSEVARRVAGAAASHRGGEGGGSIGFTVTAGGAVVGAHINSGSGESAQNALAAVRSVGSVAPPPDHRSHSLAVPFR